MTQWHQNRHLNEKPCLLSIYTQISWLFSLRWLFNDLSSLHHQKWITLVELCIFLSFAKRYCFALWIFFCLVWKYFDIWCFRLFWHVAACYCIPLEFPTEFGNSRPFPLEYLKKNPTSMFLSHIRNFWKSSAIQMDPQKTQIYSIDKIFLYSKNPAERMIISRIAFYPSNYIVSNQ